jgi:nicotinamidase-related amidase
MSISLENTAIVLIDLYNDFLHEKGKMYFATKEDLARKGTIEHLKVLVKFARSKKIPIYYGLHQQYKEGFFDGWKHMAHIHEEIKQTTTFAEGSFGALIYEGLEPSLENGDVVVSKHWNSRSALHPPSLQARIRVPRKCSHPISLSSFQNTDLDFQLRQRDISKLVLAGMTANTCLESTARYGYELGYHVTLLYVARKNKPFCVPTLNKP